MFRFIPKYVRYSFFLITILYHIAITTVVYTDPRKSLINEASNTSTSVLELRPHIKNVIHHNYPSSNSQITVTSYMRYSSYLNHEETVSTNENQHI